MSQQIRPVANVFYFVADLQPGIAWYKDLLGADPVDERSQLAMFQVGGARLTVHINDDYNTSAGVAGPVAYWDVDDVDAVSLGAWSAGEQRTVGRRRSSAASGWLRCWTHSATWSASGRRPAPDGLVPAPAAAARRRCALLGEGPARDPGAAG